LFDVQKKVIGGKEVYVLSLRDGRDVVQGDDLVKLINSSEKIFYYDKTNKLSFIDAGDILLDALVNGGIPAGAFLKQVTIFAQNQLELYISGATDWIHEPEREWSASCQVIGEEEGVHAFIKLAFKKIYPSRNIASGYGKSLLGLNVQRSYNMIGNHVYLFILLDGVVNGGYRFDIDGRTGKIAKEKEQFNVTLPVWWRDFRNQKVDFLGFLVDDRPTGELERIVFKKRKAKGTGIRAVLNGLNVTNIQTLTTNAVHANESQLKSIYVQLDFGEKSGFDAGFDFYNVDNVLRHAGINIIRCELIWDNQINSYGSFRKSGQRSGRIIGSFQTQTLAQRMADRIERIAFEKGWLHFYVSVEKLNEIVE